FFLPGSGLRRAMHSVPTRRSSDLDGGVERHPLGVLAALAVVRGQIGQVPAPAQDGLGVAGRPCFLDARAQVVAKARSTGYTETIDRKSTRLNSSHVSISYAVFCLT